MKLLCSSIVAVVLSVCGLVSDASPQNAWASYVTASKYVRTAYDTTYIFFRPAFNAAQVKPDTLDGVLPPQYVAYGTSEGVCVGTWRQAGSEAATDSSDLIVKPIVRIGSGTSDWKIVHNDSTRIGTNATADLYIGTRFFMARVPNTNPTQTPSGYAFIHKLTSGGSTAKGYVGYYLGVVVP